MKELVANSSLYQSVNQWLWVAANIPFHDLINIHLLPLITRNVCFCLVFIEDIPDSSPSLDDGIIKIDRGLLITCWSHIITFQPVILSNLRTIMTLNFIADKSGGSISYSLFVSHLSWDHSIFTPQSLPRWRNDATPSEIQRIFLLRGIERREAELVSWLTIGTICQPVHCVFGMLCFWQIRPSPCPQHKVREQS